MAALAERLGHSPDDRIAVVHVDDIGMCHASNEGAFECLDNGPATCGSLMVPCPWFEEAAARARANPGLDLGVHLTLNAEWAHYRWGPVAGRDRVRSLLDADGMLPRTLAEVMTRARPDEVEIELRAQIERALEAGVDVTHLDSHMGTVMTPPFIGIYSRLAREYRLPLFVFRPDEATLASRGMGGLAPLFAPVVDELEAEGFPIFDGFDIDSLDFPPGGGLAHNRARLERLPRGVSWLICHAARMGDELAAISADAHAREFERTFFGGAAGRQLFDEQRIRTVGMRALRDALRRNDARAPGSDAETKTRTRG